MESLLEYQFVKKITDKFSRAPSVQNQPFESDAEILQLNGCTLAITCDSIVEEIELGIYKDPFLIGWMAVVSSLSDLAAVGANPAGLLLMETIPNNKADQFIDEVQQGVALACKGHNTYIIGGDTNKGSSLQIASTAVGLLEEGTILSRKGAKEGDIVYVSNKLGIGNAYGFQQLIDQSQVGISYKPYARIKEGRIISQFGSSCIDTSDGFFHAIATLMGISSLGFNVQIKFEDLIESSSSNLMNANEIPEWFLLAGPHGEFELLFTVPIKNNKEFVKSANSIEWEPIEIGKIQKSKKFSYFDKEIDPFKISNLFTEVDNDVHKYLNHLKRLDKEWQL